MKSLSAGVEYVGANGRTLVTLLSHGDGSARGPQARPVWMLGLAASLLASGCVAHNSQSAWAQVIKQCADTEILKDAVYLGQSNVVGPGSLWTKASDGYSLQYRVTDIIADPADIERVMQKGTDTECSGNSTVSFSVEAGIPVVLSAARVDVNVAAALKAADSITVKTKSVALDMAVQGPFQQVLAKLAEDGQIGKDVFAPGRLIVTKAIRVSGFEADFHFSTSASGEIRLKIAPNQVIGLGADGAKLTASFLDEKTLSVASPGEFYIAVAFSQLQGSGTGASRVVVLVPANTPPATASAQ